MTEVRGIASSGLILASTIALMSTLLQHNLQLKHIALNVGSSTRQQNSRIISRPDLRFIDIQDKTTCQTSLSLQVSTWCAVNY